MVGDAPVVAEQVEDDDGGRAVQGEERQERLSVRRHRLQNRDERVATNGKVLTIITYPKPARGAEDGLQRADSGLPFGKTEGRRAHRGDLLRGPAPVPESRGQTGAVGWSEGPPNPPASICRAGSRPTGPTKATGRPAAAAPASLLGKTQASQPALRATRWTSPAPRVAASSDSLGGPEGDVAEPPPGGLPLELGEPGAAANEEESRWRDRP